LPPLHHGFQRLPGSFSAGSFWSAGGLKVIDPQSSVAAVRAYRLLPTSVATIVGWGQPFAEVALGLLLLAGVATRLVAAAVAVLLVVFIAAVASAAIRGLEHRLWVFRRWR
jgi:uncharacterized membrane protein YphA (DoxX/SURF4 family)